MAKLRDYTTICASAPSEILAIYALQNREIIIREQLERLYRNLDLLDAFFGEYDDCLSWSRPKGGSVGFPRLLISGGATDFCDRLVRKTGIMLVPSSVFQFGDSHVRFGFGRENLPVVIDVFKSYLDHLYR
jgi:aspartate/methionine/tyrosine aminotransferase